LEFGFKMAHSELTKRLRPGQVYRRQDLARWTRAVDRDLKRLLKEHRLEKVSQGLYMVPRKTRFGPAPAAPEKLVSGFLKDDRFLIVPPNAHHGLGLGTSQLRNEPLVYNSKRHGRFALDGRVYDFRMRTHVPNKLSKEVLLVEMLHNLNELPEEGPGVLPRALAKARQMDKKKLGKAVRHFGSARAKRLLEPILST
jgi:hypothetical protein